MKNVIIGVLVICTVVAVYMAATSRLRMSSIGIEGKREKIIRGDLTVPIDATGQIRPGRRVEAKAEASGEVIAIHKQAGERVRAGDLLIQLQPDDEERSVNRAKLELDIAKARLETAKIILEQAKTADRASARAQVDQLEASLEYARFRKEKIEKLKPDQRSEEEVLQRDTAFRSQKAQLDAARAALAKVEHAISRAQQEVLQAEAAYESARNNLGDAQKRLSKTDIVAPIEGIVGDIRVQIGEVIQGGKTTFTGGTVLAVLLDVDKLIVRAEVDESDIGRVLAIAPPWAKPGNDGSVPVPDDFAAAAAEREHLPKITVESFRDQEFAGIIERVYPEPRNVSGVVTYNVDVVITSENRSMLLSGMRADVRFTSDHAENVLLCPNEAIREGPSGKLGVYIPKKDALPTERATEFVECRLGLDNGNYSEVLEGLTEGTEVYTKLPARTRDDKDKDRRKKR